MIYTSVIVRQSATSMSPGDSYARVRRSRTSAIAMFSVCVCLVSGPRRLWVSVCGLQFSKEVKLPFLSLLSLRQLGRWVVAHSTRQMMILESYQVPSTTVIRRCRQWNSCFEKSIHKLLVTCSRRLCMVIEKCRHSNQWMNEWMNCTVLYICSTTHSSFSLSHHIAHTPLMETIINKSEFRWKSQQNHSRFAFSLLRFTSHTHTRHPQRSRSDRCEFRHFAAHKILENFDSFNFSFPLFVYFTFFFCFFVADSENKLEITQM